MYIVDIENGTVKPARESHEEVCPIMEAAKRLTDELKGWKMYKRMAGENPEAEDYAKYSPVASQEFQHALLAASDLVIRLKRHSNDAEKEQIMRFMASLATG